jgi:spoIIIJ-associated protein
LLDVGGYRERRKESLVELAKKVADEVRQTGGSVSLEPMSPYERRIVHLALEGDPNVITESKGEGEERRVVIKTRKGGG